jgi:D-lactate dehydrogenase
VVLSRDAGAHLRNLKTTPPIEEIATTCVECGFCEPVCPSRLLTTTPRQRIVVRREMARQRAGSPVHRALVEQYEYDAIQSCAADGTCALACPLGIDTGKLVKEFRAREHGERAEWVAMGIAKRWADVERGARAGLRFGSPLRGASRVVRSLLSHELIPEWDEGMARPAPARLPITSREGAAAVYVPSCVNRIFGSSRANGAGGPERATLPEALVEVSRRARLPVWIPPDVAGHCCATPWSSKGYRAGHAWMANRIVESLWRWTGGAELPAVIDASSCTHGLLAEAGGALTEQNLERHSRLEIIDAVFWASDRLVPRLGIARKVDSVAVHPTCAARHLGLDGSLRRLAAALGEEVFIPPSAFCCGFAGDRGLLHPELTEAATREEAAEVGARGFDAHISSNRTCELALERATGRPYVHAVQLLEGLSRPS